MHSEFESISIESELLDSHVVPLGRLLPFMPIPVVGDVLSAHRKQIVESMLRLVPAEHRREFQALLANYDQTIERMGSGSKKYSGLQSPIEAVMQYFAETRVPAAEKEIADAIIEGGFLGGDTRNYSRITASINVHINGPQKIRGKNPLKKINGLIGPEKWDDSLFE